MTNTCKFLAQRGTYVSSMLIYLTFSVQSTALQIIDIEMLQEVKELG